MVKPKAQCAENSAVQVTSHERKRIAAVFQASRFPRRKLIDACYAQGKSVGQGQRAAENIGVHGGAGYG